jgi:hypothetical protein
MHFPHQPLTRFRPVRNAGLVQALVHFLPDGLGCCTFSSLPQVSTSVSPMSISDFASATVPLLFTLVSWTSSTTLGTHFDYGCHAAVLVGNPPHLAASWTPTGSFTRRRCLRTPSWTLSFFCSWLVHSSFIGHSSTLVTVRDGWRRDRIDM